jgi:phytoene synthase
VYSFARRVDDIADGEGSAEARLAALDAARADLHRLGEPTNDRVMLALADAAGRFPIPLDAFDDLIAGARMDVLGAHYERYGDLIVYCRRVAGSIGRLSLGVFGAAGSYAAACRHADDLGVAMQLTNILRDVGEDRAAGRVYLPDADLEAFGCDIGAEPTDALAELVRFEAARAHGWFAVGRRLLPFLDRPSAACVATIAGTYEQLLRRIEREPKDVLLRRLSLPAWTKAWIATRAVMGVRT